MKSLVFLSLAGLIIFSGCAGGIYVGSDTFKPNLNSTILTQYRNDAPNYEVLGPVSAEVESTSILAGLFAGGEDGQAVLWKEAKKIYGDKVTGIKDINASKEFVNVLWVVYWNVRTTYYGTAIQELSKK